MSMTEADHRRYDAEYAADMHAQADIECCASAGAELIRLANGRWLWKRQDECRGTFDTKEEAADHFTHSDTFYAWLRSRGVRV
jgi:hypothetical protein